ncbi:hypothetical protein ES705_26647 [subsurface metagenome]
MIYNILTIAAVAAAAATGNRRDACPAGGFIHPKADLIYRTPP